MKTRREAIFRNRWSLSNAIVLYVSNLMRKVVPENTFQMPDENLETRRLTPERIALDALSADVAKLAELSFIFSDGTTPDL